jgi:hypothetical protein
MKLERATRVSCQQIHHSRSNLPSLGCRPSSSSSAFIWAIASYLAPPTFHVTVACKSQQNMLLLMRSFLQIEWCKRKKVGGERSWCPRRFCLVCANMCARAGLKKSNKLKASLKSRLKWSQVSWRQPRHLTATNLKQ